MAPLVVDVVLAEVVAFVELATVVVEMHGGDTDSAGGGCGGESGLRGKGSGGLAIDLRLDGGRESARHASETVPVQ